MSQSIARKARRKGFLPPVHRNFLPGECIQLVEMENLLNSKNWELANIKGNTALVTDGQKYVEQLEAIINLLNDAKQMWIAQTLVKCGYQPGTKCSVNMSTGVITINDETGDDTKVKG